MPLFSVIVPTYNRRDLLARTLQSVQAQTFADYELIVVDDGSTDDTRAYVASLGGGIALLRQSNRGPGAARNLGLAHAKGEYVAFLDSDDVWFPWTLETYAEVVRRASSPAFIAGKPLRFAAERELQAVAPAALALSRFADYYASGDDWRWWSASSFVVRTAELRRVGGFADRRINGEDADLAMRLGTAPGFVQIEAPVTFGYREHAASIMKDAGRTLDGAWHMVETEQSGGYAGGAARARDRRRVLTRHVRPVSLACLRDGRLSDGLRLYWSTAGWHLRLGRWKYLIGFPLQALLTGLRSVSRPAKAVRA